MKPPGVQVADASSTFVVWAPLRSQMELHLLSPVDRLVPMACDDDGRWTATVEKVGHGALYRYRLDNSIERPDPASQCQPEGVHGPSMVVDRRRFSWSDHGLRRRRLEDYIIYEMHVGTFTAEGTFAAAIDRLPELVELGITAVEIMPVAQFPGTRNWGYDGVYPFAVQWSYGGADGLKYFVNECHCLNLAAVLDVVYNHLGPEGNYLRDFAPYFTDRYRTPWGESLNFDGPYSDGVVAFFIANACFWLREFHFDALRLDAVHAICDRGARPFLQRLSEAIEGEFGAADPSRYLIAESDLNDARVLHQRTAGGFGLHAQWNDDFHHSVHAVLTGERRGYYVDFGECDQVMRTLTKGFCYDGQYSKFRKRSHGNDVSGLDTGKFVVCSQNHDQVGNRMLGERLISLTDLARARLAAAAVLLSPYIPLVFMGEEHGEDCPFLYFADHTDESLRKAVREGRKAEFAGFRETGEPPDPFDPFTFERSKIDWSKRSEPQGSAMMRYYKELIRVRHAHPALGPCGRERLEIRRFGETGCISLRYLHDVQSVICIFNFSGNEVEALWGRSGQWRRIFDSCEAEEADLPDFVDCAETTLRLKPWQCAVFVVISNEGVTEYPGR
ncbi:MAG: malto-oligosyltrehalose trehalohydrolase [Chitinispirillaceae bacterium]|nr:malto-oligosyltrehalose trehalohydrolase [Chitinispirillaceae bacterium]